MLLKGLFIGGVSLSCLSLLFMAPRAVGVTPASPDKVQRQAVSHGRTGGTSRARYGYVGGYYRGK